MATTIKIKSSNVADKVPTTGQLETGELALNFPDQKIYTKDPSGNVIVLAQGTNVAYEDTEFTATASQTTFTVDYTAGAVDVFMNGIKLDVGDYTATNGTSIVLDTGAEVGSTISVRAWSSDVNLQGPQGIQGEQGDPATVTTTNVTAAGALMDSEVTNLAQVKAFDSSDYATAAQGTTADSAQQPPSEGAFVDGDKTKLDAIEASADVTDTINVTAAGALMDSEVTNLAQVKAFDSSDYATAAQGATADSALQSVAFGDLTTTPTTKAGYGITDVYTETEADSAISTAIGNLIDSAPAALDTLNELAASLGDDSDFAGTMTTNLAGKLNLTGGALTGAVTTTSTFDGRDVSVDGAKLDAIEASADVTDTINVTAAGALMDSEVTNLAQVKAFDSSDYATAAQGTTADAALPKAGGAMTGAITTNSTFDGRDVATDGTKLDTIDTNANNYSHPTHPGDDASVDTGALTGATVISDLDFNITTDTQGHVTDANASVATRTLTLANLGYTGETNATADQTKADIDALGIDAETLDGIDSASFLRSDASDTFADLTGDDVTVNGTMFWQVSSSDAAKQRADARDDGTSFSRVHWYGMSDTGTTSNFRHAWYDGSAYINVTCASGTVTFDGAITATGDITAYSDERLKENVEVINGAVHKVKQLQGVTYDRKDGSGSSTGLIAQDVQKVLPEAVVEDAEGMMSVKYGNTVGLLVEAIKELSAKIEAQQEEIDNLKNQ